MQATAKSLDNLRQLGFIDTSNDARSEDTYTRDVALTESFTPVSDDERGDIEKQAKLMQEIKLKRRPERALGLLDDEPQRKRRRLDNGSYEVPEPSVSIVSLL